MMMITNRINHKTRVLYTALLLCFALYAQAQVPGKIKQTGQVLLPNGWKLSPAGRSLPTGDLPLNIQLSTSGKLLAVTNNGQSTQSVQLIDPKSEKLLDEKVLAKSWYGLAFSRDEQHCMYLAVMITGSLISVSKTINSVKPIR
jgi:hypothetical protein